MFHTASASAQLDLVRSPRRCYSEAIQVMHRIICHSSAILLWWLCLTTQAAETNRFRIIRDVTYARVGELDLKLDLHLPGTKPRAPLMVWVHGGAWRSGSKKDMPLGKLVEEGYAVASVDYRLSTQAKFPAQVHDLKAAIRFVRGHGAGWRLPTKQILIAGDSAGGHLAALVGVSNGNAELEGDLGGDRAQSSDVQGIISFYGGANLTTILGQIVLGLGGRRPKLHPTGLCRDRRLIAVGRDHFGNPQPPRLRGPRRNDEPGDEANRCDD